MKSKEKVDFCTACRKETGYTLQKMSLNKRIKDKEHIFYITNAVCNECGGEMGILGLFDKNIQEFSEQYKACLK